MEIFKLRDKVKVVLNGAIGSVIGVADFKYSGRMYSVEYAQPSGEIKSAWFGPDEIVMEQAKEAEQAGS